MRRFWTLYVAWKIRRGLDGHWVRGLDGLRAELARGPVLLAANHVSWWDGLLMYAVNVALGADARVIVAADSVRRMPFLRAGGAIAMEPGAAAWGALREAERHLSGPGRLVWIFPQGRQRPASVRPLAFSRGLVLLAKRSGAAVVPVSLDYPFRAASVPAAAMVFGDAVGVAGVERAVEEGLDAIRAWADAADGPERVGAERMGEGGPATGFVSLTGGGQRTVQAGLGARILALLTGGAPLRLGGARG